MTTAEALKTMEVQLALEALRECGYPMCLVSPPDPGEMFWRVVALGHHAIEQEASGSSLLTCLRILLDTVGPPGKKDPGEAFLRSGFKEADKKRPGR